MEKSKHHKRKPKQKIQPFKIFCFVISVVLILVVVIKVLNIKREKSGKNPITISSIFDSLSIRNFDLATLATVSVPDYVDVQIIDIDGDSRRGEKLDGFNDVVIHYVGNPGSTAQGNRDYYANPESEVSSHFVVGLNGEIIQCIPLDEKSSASNNRNHDTISIEVCHPDESGRFNDATYNSLVKLTAWLIQMGDLKENHIIRHYDITEKECPKYFVNNEDAWEIFKLDVKYYCKKH